MRKETWRFKDDFWEHAQTPEWEGAQCQACFEWLIWYVDELCWPVALIGPTPHDRMPDQIRSLYEEARAVGGRSPRSAGALLRLALQALVLNLTDEHNLDKAIGQLVGDGLPRRVQQAMDVLRIVGNNAVHPGEINLDESPETATALFKLLNVIVEDRIAQPAEIKDLYDSMPPGALEAIQRRDGRAVTDLALTPENHGVASSRP